MIEQTLWQRGIQRKLMELFLEWRGYKSYPGGIVKILEDSYVESGRLLELAFKQEVAFITGNGDLDIFAKPSSVRTMTDVTKKKDK